MDSHQSVNMAGVKNAVAQNATNAASTSQQQLELKPFVRKGMLLQQESLGGDPFGMGSGSPIGFGRGSEINPKQSTSPMLLKAGDKAQLGQQMSQMNPLVSGPGAAASQDITPPTVADNATKSATSFNT